VIAAPVQAPPKIGRWIAAAVAAIALLTVGGYAWHQHQVEAARIEKFRSEVTHALSTGKSALKKSGDYLDKAIEELETVMLEPLAHVADDFKPAEVLASLKARREALSKRKAEFDRLLAEAQKLRSAAPSQAMKALIEAEKLGGPDEEQG